MVLWKCDIMVWQIPMGDQTKTFFVLLRCERNKRENKAIKRSTEKTNYWTEANQPIRMWVGPANKRRKIKINERKHIKSNTKKRTAEKICFMVTVFVTHLQMHYSLRWYRMNKQQSPPDHWYLLQTLHKISFYRLAIDICLGFHWSKMGILLKCCSLVALSNTWPNFGWVYSCRRCPFCIRERCANTPLYRNLCIQQQFRGRRSTHTRQYRRIQRNSVL